MSNDIQIFNSAEFGSVRAIMIDDEPWFVAKDVCKALDLDDTSKALSRIREKDRKPLKAANTNLSNVGDYDDLNGSNGGRSPILVSESGLYDLVLGSRKQEALQFKYWIIDEVLPSIRKTGSYTVPSATPKNEMLEHLQCLNYVLDTWGIDKDEKVLAMSKFYKRETGVTLIEYVPAKEDEQCDHYEGVTEIAKKLSDVLGAKVSRNSMNPVLVSLGLQVATGNSHCRFDLTPKGKELGGRKEYVDPEHTATSVANIKWMPGKLIPYLVEVFEKSPLIFSVK